MINYKQLKKQIVRDDGCACKPGYMFIATDEQKNNGIDSIFQEGSKKGLLKTLTYLINCDDYFRREFFLKA